jgi:hypothetical protein
MEHQELKMANQKSEKSYAEDVVHARQNARDEQ